MNEYFKKVPMAQNKTSDFDLSHEVKLSLDMGRLIPVYIQECLPGDSFRIENQLLIKFSPLVAPVMSRINAHMHTFFVPYRVLEFTGEHDGFQFHKWITGEQETTPPNIDLRSLNIAFGSIGDYFGLPIGNHYKAGMTEPINTLPFYAYMKIYNDFYRNPNLQTEIWYEGTNNADLGAFIEGKPLTRNFESDYFQDARPWAQNGDEAEALVNITYRNQGVTTTNEATDAYLTSKANTGLLYLGLGGQATNVDNIEEASVSANEIRYAEALQQVLETLARSGKMYKNWVKAFFGVISKDSRLDMVEYIGGSKSPVIISETFNQTGTADQVQGTMTGNAMSVDRNNFSNYQVEEHGIIMTILSVMPEVTYTQGLPSMYSRLTPYDYPLPQFAELGDQAILKKEIFFSDTDANNNSEFGYVDRYYDWKQTYNKALASFRGTLQFWNITREFDTQPSLNAAFLRAVPTEFTEIFAIENLPDNHQLYCQVYNKIGVRRALPFYVMPTIG